MQKAYRYLSYRQDDFPVTEKYAREILSLPIFPELKEDMVKKIVQVIKKFWARSTLV
jgi:dTDP-4-amino-4,6-dideoxygalactose transaminase